MTSNQTTTIATAYARANKLLKRALSLNIGKNGKPLNLDQAIELVAAEEGFRNRHAMDAKLKAKSRCSSPRKDAQNEAAAEAVWQSLVNIQGWNESSQILHLESFIRSQGLMPEFVQHAKRFASEECAEAALCGEFAELHNQVLELLEDHQYTIQVSDLGGYYWTDPQDNASEDFQTEEAACFDIFCNLGRKSGLEGATFANLPAAEQLELVRKVLAGEQKLAMSAALRALEAQWGHEHPFYDRADWQHDASEGNTKLGYWEWVQHAIEANGGEDEHCSCGNPLHDNEGYDGMCGSCADRADGDQAGDIEVDRTSYTTFSFSLGELNAEQLAEVSPELELDPDTQSASEMRSLLLEDYERKCRAVAEAAFANFEFGDEWVVEASNGWETSTNGVFKCTVFLQSYPVPQAQSVKATFICVIEGLKVTSAAYSLA